MLQNTGLGIFQLALNMATMSRQLTVNSENYAQVGSGGWVLHLQNNTKGWVGVISCKSNMRAMQTGSRELTCPAS